MVKNKKYFIIIVIPKDKTSYPKSHYYLQWQHAKKGDGGGHSTMA